MLKIHHRMNQYHDIMIAVHDINKQDNSITNTTTIIWKTIDEPIARICSKFQENDGH